MKVQSNHGGEYNGKALCEQSRCTARGQWIETVKLFLTDADETTDNFIVFRARVCTDHLNQLAKEIVRQYGTIHLDLKQAER